MACINLTFIISKSYAFIFTDDRKYLENLQSTQESCQRKLNNESSVITPKSGVRKVLFKDDENIRPDLELRVGTANAITPKLPADSSKLGKKVARKNTASHTKAETTLKKKV